MNFCIANKALFLILLVFLPVRPATVFFDPDCFIQAIRSREIWDIGPSKLIGFYNPATIIENYFAALNQILPHDKLFPTVVKDGLTLPQIIKNWLCNIQPADIIRNFALTELKKLHQTQGLNTSLFQAIAEHVFTPHRYAQARDYNKEGLKILQKIHKQKVQGQQKHKLYAISNQNTESFIQLSSQKGIKRGTDLFNRIIISGNAHMLKPDPRFYEYALKELMIPDNELIVYVDVELSYIQGFEAAAKKMGKKNVHTIHCKDFNFKPVAKELKRLAIYT